MRRKFQKKKKTKNYANTHVFRFIHLEKPKTIYSIKYLESYNLFKFEYDIIYIYFFFFLKKANLFIFNRVNCFFVSSSFFKYSFFVEYI